VKGARDEHRRLLTAVGTLAPLIQRGHVFAAFPEAVAHAVWHVAAEPDPSLAVSRPRTEPAVPSWSSQTDTLAKPSADLSPTVPNERVSL
jgi:hypothetical protein